MKTHLQTNRCFNKIFKSLKLKVLNFKGFFVFLFVISFRSAFEQNTDNGNTHIPSAETNFCILSACEMTKGFTNVQYHQISIL